VVTLWLRWSFSSGMSELGFKLFFDPHTLGLVEIFLSNLFRIVERFLLTRFSLKYEWNKVLSKV
jgi:hypothetical protein